MVALLSRDRNVTNSDVSKALLDCSRAFWGVALFSAVVNILMLSGPLYMLQIYDRVLASRSVPTLVALTLFLIAAYGFQGVLDLIRSRVVVKAAALFDERLSGSIHRAVIMIGTRSNSASEAHQPVRDLDQVRAFMTSAGPTAIADMPWVPIFLAICFLIHPWIGYLSFVCAAILLLLTIQTERASRRFVASVNESAGRRTAMMEADRRNHATVVSMGMVGALSERWRRVNENYVATVGRSTDVVNSYSGVIKVLRLLMQSAILGLGAYLVIRQQMTAGAMIAASIMMGRALAPIEIAIANWRGFVAARDGARRLSHTLSRIPVDRGATELPKPVTSLIVEHVTVAAPGATSAIVANVNFQLSAGEVLGVIGPNGSGKSSLTRVLSGIWPPARGTVRLDGAALDQWDTDARGQHIGYVSQIVELFPGTVAENIARMASEVDSAAVVRAAQIAGAHDMILRLPQGYDTMIGDSGEGLSVGQRQRIAFARAVYGDPFLVMLDEPSANLDGDGETALQDTIRRLKARRAVVIIVVHRRSALITCDKVLMLLNGAQRAFGPRDEVLRQIGETPVAQPMTANLKIVGEAPAKEQR
ncbi:MAG: type I secretion system permease/ATPase [Xanthobacteraceae bacterium]